MLNQSQRVISGRSTSRQITGNNLVNGSKVNSKQSVIRMSHFLLGLFPTDQEILRQVLTACARMSAKTVQGQNTVDQITGPSLCFNTKRHMFWSLYFVGCQHGNLHQIILTMSRVICFIPRVNTEYCLCHT